MAMRNILAKRHPVVGLATSALHVSGIGVRKTNIPSTKLAVCTYSSNNKLLDHYGGSLKQRGSVLVQKAIFSRIVDRPLVSDG